MNGIIPLKNSKIKIIIGFLGLHFIIFMAITYTSFKIMHNELANKVKSYTLSLAQLCAEAIDPTKHSTFINQEARNDPEYWRYFHLLNKIYSREKYLSRIFTLQYDKEKDTFSYGVDGIPAESDKIWMESDFIRFSIYNNTMGLLTIKHNLTEYTNDFAIQTRQGNIQFNIINRGRLKKILINDMEVIKVIAEEPLVLLSAGKEIHPLNRYLKIQMPLFENLEIFKLSFIGKGEPEFEPGIEYAEEWEKETNKQIIKSNHDQVEDARSTTYGKDIKATALIRNREGIPTGVVVLYVESKIFQESIETFLAKVSIEFIITFLMTILLGFLLAGYLEKTSAL